MEDNFALYVIVMLHIGFAAAIPMWHGNKRFVRLFAACWLVEAVRASILLPEVHSIAGRFESEWFCLAEMLCFVSAALLFSSGAALVGRRISRKLTLICVGIGMTTVLLNRYFVPQIIETVFSISDSDARFGSVLFNLFLMFAPFTAIRLIFSWWLSDIWRQTRDTGAAIAFFFGCLSTVITASVPFQFYYSWYPPWIFFAWCFEVFGFSMGILLLIISRSEREILESNEQLRSALDRLEVAQQHAIGQARLGALGQMAAGVAHDVNNSLTPLMTYADLLEMRTSFDSEAKEFCRLIQLSADDMAKTVRRLNHFFRESHNREFLETLDLVDLVQQTVKLTQPKWQDQSRTDGKQLYVSVSVLSDSCPNVRGEASELRSVLTNLIFNACEAIDDVGTIELLVDCDENEASVSIIDSGVGMNPEQLDRCLDPFYTSKFQGSGLGLSECHGIIRRHGGEISVSSVLGQQTTVRFTLPIDVSSPLSKKCESTSADPVQEKLPRILCIEDDDQVAAATTSLLQHLPAKIQVVNDGKSAINILNRETFDLVLCDQGLPGMDGISVLHAIKSQWSNVPVVMVSGWTLPEIMDGPTPDEFISKPYTMDELFSSIRKHLQPQGSAAV